MSDSLLFVTVFIACAVEMVEALTIILAIGTTRGWRSTFLASISALVCLVAIVAIFGRVLTRNVSQENNPTIERLWLIAGGLILVLGLQWTKKSILRFTSISPSRDEDKVFKRVTGEAKTAAKEKDKAIDWYGFTIAFKGVLIEGLEVIFILITFSATQNNLRLGVLAALAALLLVMLIGILIHKPLTRVPENLMKLVVGVLLTSFGTYFATEGIGIEWPHGNLAIIGILAFYTAITFVFIKILSASTNSADVLKHD
jgi:uncharacterized membrane protein